MVKTDATLQRLGDTGRTVADPRDDVRGTTVVDIAGHDLGKVDDLLVDTETARVQFLRLERGGTLRRAVTSSFLPVEAVRRVDGDTVHLDRSREVIVSAPAYDPAVTDERRYYGSLYDYYGFTPYWVGGYVYPHGLRTRPRERGTGRRSHQRTDWTQHRRERRGPTAAAGLHGATRNRALDNRHP